MDTRACVNTRTSTAGNGLADTVACVDHAQPATPIGTDNLVVLVIV